MEQTMDFQKNPVLIVAADTIIGLTVVRSLGRHGVPVYCAHTVSGALGPGSKYCRASFRLPKEDQPAMAAIVEHARRWKVTHLLAISEKHIALLNHHRGELQEQFTLLFPAQEVVERATHKDLTLAYAGRIGIPIPVSRYPQSIEEAEGSRDLQFPVILKMAHRESPSGAQLVFQHKYLRVDTFEELRRVLGELPPGQFPIIQEYIPGSGVGMSMLIRNGKAILAFQHRRLREYPPDGGVGVFCEAMPMDAKLFEQSEQLLLQMGWDGVAMVEYRGDPDRFPFLALLHLVSRCVLSSCTRVSGRPAREILGRGYQVVAVGAARKTAACSPSLCRVPRRIPSFDPVLHMGVG
jgi:predicted ATP-grasp superfamily ATP-dependent carboligase